MLGVVFFSITRARREAVLKLAPFKAPNLTGSWNHFKEYWVTRPLPGSQNKLFTEEFAVLVEESINKMASVLKTQKEIVASFPAPSCSRKFYSSKRPASQDAGNEKKRSKHPFRSRPIA